MTAAAPLDPAFPGIAPEVVAAYRDAPDNMVAEILDGALSLMPRPRPTHAKPGGWVVLIEPELHLGPVPTSSIPTWQGLG